MERGITWTEEESADLSRAWINATQDPIYGIDETVQRFYQAMFDRFSSFAPVGSNAKTYKGRGLRATRAKWEAISADCQKFRSALRFIKACNPTGILEDQILSMAIAKHLGKRSTMAYDAKDYPHLQWPHHAAFKVLRRVAKFGNEEEAGTTVN